MPRRSHGTGRFRTRDLRSFGAGSLLEESVLVFKPECVAIGEDVYVGHGTILKGDTRGELVLGDGVWVGEHCYLNAAGGLSIGDHTGLGPGSMILTSVHERSSFPSPITAAPLRFGRVEIGAGCDIGIGAVVLPGSRIGDGVQVGAGAVVSGDLPEGAIAAGVPARVIDYRDGSPGTPSGGG
jgi:acetyltransferase-like isoleucine patch superfamily enzyme